MSSLSHSIEQLKKYNEQRDLEARKELLSAISKLQQDLKRQLNEDAQSFRNDLESQKQVILKDLTKLYKVPFWILIGIGLVLALGMAYFAREATMQYNRMVDWKQSANLYKEQSKGIMLANCNLSDKITKLCVRIDPQYKDQAYGDDQDYRIIKLGKN